MTKRDVLGIAIRILGLWTLATVIPWLPSLAYPFSRAMGLPAAGARQIFFIQLVSYCIVLIVGFYLLAYAKRIAAALMPEDGEFGWPEWVTRRGVLFGFGVGILGLVLVARNLPLVLAYIVQYIWAWRTSVSVRGLAAGWPTLTSQAIALAIGLGLLFGFRKLAAWIEGGNQVQGPEMEPKHE